MRLIILQFMYFVVVMWQLMWTTCKSREFTYDMFGYTKPLLDWSGLS
jgi:hypothetical protein